MNSPPGWSRLRRALVLAALGPVLSHCAGPVAPELVIVNAKVFTNDTTRPWAAAVAIKGERVILLGESAAVRATARPSTRIIDAGGRVLVPGFNDARVDLPLEPPTPAGLAALDRAAIARGVTSLQVVAGGPMRSLVVAAQRAQRQARWRLVRSPEDTTTLSTRDATAIVRQDEEPYLPPQPGVRLAANGVAWHLGGDDRVGRRAVDRDRIGTVVGWAYGAEDPIVMAGEARHWIAALSRVGLPEVWRRKRPRFDIDGIDDPETAQAMARLGVTVTWTPAALRRDRPGPEPFSMPHHFAGVYVDQGVVVCLGSAGEPAPGTAIAAAVGAMGDAGGRPLSREEAVRALTWGSAFAQKAERDTGWLGIGTLADLAVLSDDVFTVPADRLPAITSVLTVVGGAIVYDPGQLTK